MLKEIFEQPETVENAMRGRFDVDAATAKFGGLNLTPQQLRSIDRFVMTACGTSWHAAMVGEYQIETLARIRSKSNTPANCATAIRRWTTTRWSSPSPRAARRPTRWPPCGK